MTAPAAQFDLAQAGPSAPAATWPRSSLSCSAISPAASRQISLVALVYVKINGEMHYLWRSVDHEGEVLESYVTKTRDNVLAFIKRAIGASRAPRSRRCASTDRFRAIA